MGRDDNFQFDGESNSNIEKIENMKLVIDVINVFIVIG